jgi:hypothetical protein
MPEANSGLNQRLFKRETATEQKIDKIRRVNSPQVLDSFCADSVTPDLVAWNNIAYVRSWRQFFRNAGVWPNDLQ